MKEIQYITENDIKKVPYYYIKIVLDIAITLILAIPVLVVVLIFSILVKMDSKGPAFYTQMRLGQNGKEFKIYKIRSMCDDAEISTGSVWAEKDDPRITKIGRFMRKMRIDELPQFLNILKLDMSLIGPRPERKDLTFEFEKTVPHFSKRTLVKPGITGLAQINGGYDISPKEKFEIDQKYIHQFSFKQDIKIFFKTVKVVLTGEGAR